MESVEFLKNPNNFILISPLDSEEPMEMTNSRANIGDQTFSPIKLDSMKQLNKIYSFLRLKPRVKKLTNGLILPLFKQNKTLHPIRYPPYSYFYLLQLNPEISTQNLMECMLQHLQLKSAKIEQQQHYLWYELNQKDALVELMGAHRPIKTIIERIIGQKQIYGPNYRSSEKSDGRWPRLYLVYRNDQSNI